MWSVVWWSWFEGRIVVEQTISHIGEWTRVASIYNGYPNSISMRPFGEYPKSKTVRAFAQSGQYHTYVEFGCAPRGDHLGALGRKLRRWARQSKARPTV